MRNTSLLCLVLVALAPLAGCGAGDFTGQHIQELQKDCAETVRCKSGSIVGENSDTMSNCVEKSGEMLDGADESVQQEFVNTVARCNLLQQCDYVSCTQSDPNAGYAGMHREDIMNFCTQYVACQIAMGQSVNFSVPDCAAQSANKLNFATIQEQQQFEAKAAKCRGLAGCQWINCN